mmetsp:Transcript_9531/g.14315  ORF Transcript_9531/g.14315 Transcript_9531/m.14315 type:complete len:211 (-) Transcript_9531:208-840(-)
MSNCQEFWLPLVEVKRFQTKAALKCIFHTIIFNRSLHSEGLAPKDIDCDIFEVSYARNDNKEVAKIVSHGIHMFIKKMDEGKLDKGVACLSFYNVTEQKSGWNFFFQSDNKFVWEKWLVPISITDRKSFSVDSSKHQLKRQEMLRDSVTYVIKTVNERQEHLPPIKQNEKQNEVTSKLGCFPFEISYSKTDKSRWGLLMRALQKGPPKLM